MDEPYTRGHKLDTKRRIRFHLDEVNSQGQKAGPRFPVAGGGATEIYGPMVRVWGDGKVLEIEVMAVQHCECN